MLFEGSCRSTVGTLVGVVAGVRVDVALARIRVGSLQIGYWE